MPNQPPGPLLTPSRILEVMNPDDGLSRRSPYRSFQQILNLPLWHIITGQSDGVQAIPLLQELIDLWAGEGRIGSEVPPHSGPRGATRFSTSLQSWALCTFPGRSLAPSQFPNWLNTNSG